MVVLSFSMKFRYDPGTFQSLFFNSTILPVFEFPLCTHVQQHPGLSRNDPAEFLRTHLNCFGVLGICIQKQKKKKEK
jgi:hypothetical protein